MNRQTEKRVLGVDAGSKTIGLSATTEEIEIEIFSAEVELRSDIVDLLATREEIEIFSAEVELRSAEVELRYEGGRKQKLFYRVL